MANIKFSAFTQKVASADVDFLVGYTGGDNVRITPSVFDDRYLPLAGGTMTGDLRLNDGIELELGNDADIRMYHDDSNGYINSFKGDLYIRTFDNDKDIIFQSDNGSGGTATYFYLDGSNSYTNFQLNARWVDNARAQFGNSGDFNIRHNGVDSYFENETGDLNIINKANDKDIIFQSDNGSGGTATYIEVDGTNVRTKFSKNTIHTDNIKANFGSGSDLQLYHTGTKSLIVNVNGDLDIQNQADDGDILFKSDDGGGGTTEYFRLDGGIVRNVFSKNVGLEDNIKLIIGSGNDLQIYHDGSNSFISDITGTGDLKIQSNRLWFQSSTGEAMGRFTENGSAELYYDNALRLSTTNTGVKITGVNQYADNAAALAGGLTVGDVYRTGDLLKIVN
jgi:hypothetical protein